MIHLSLAIHCAESSLAAPILSILTGTAAEAVPDNPGQVLVTLSKDYQLPQGYDVRFDVSERTSGDPSAAVPIAPGETRLSDAVDADVAYVKLYLVRSSDEMVVQQTFLPAVALLGATGPVDPATGPVLTEASASAHGATAAQGAVTTDEGSGVLYWIATGSESAPEVSGIVAGHDRDGAAAAGSGSVPVEAAGRIEVAVSDLTPGNTYYLHFAQCNAAGTHSGVVSSGPVTPAAAVIEDLTNPVVEDIHDDAPLRTAWDGVTADDYAADNGATVTEVITTYQIDGKAVADGEVTGTAGDTLTIVVTVRASDGSETQFTYGPAAISAAPVVDLTPPVLSDFEVSANGPHVVRGTVVTSEAGGALHWLGTSASAVRDEEELSAMLDGAVFDLSGTIPVSEPGAVPLEFAGLEPDESYVFHCCHEDAAGNRSNIVTASAKTLPAGDLTITIEDFSRDKVPFHSKLAAGEAPVEGWKGTTKEEILALKDGSSVGSRHEGAYKIPGKATLPEGISLSGSRIDVGGDFDGWLEGWDFTGYTLSWRGGEVRLRNSILGERDGPAGLHFYLDIYPGATVVEITNNDFLGPNGYGGAGVAISYRTSGSDGSAKGPRMAPGRVARNRFFGLSSDAIKPTGGVIEENAILYQNNLDGPALAWSSSRLYAKGELARNGSDNVFRSKADGNRGNPVPSRKSDTAHWESLDPHCDAINPATVTDPLTIGKNYVDMDADPARSVGMNNAIRSVPNNGSTQPHDRVDVFNNVLIGATGGAGKLIQATDNGNPNYAADRFYNNWVKARSDGDILHARQADGTVWENNRSLDTDEVIPGTPDTVADASLAEVVTAASVAAPAYLARVSRSGTATPGYAIEARAVPEDGAGPDEWTEIATADKNGNWEGALDVRRAPHAYRFEVRLKDAPYTSAKTARTFLSGLLIAVHTQSDIAIAALKDRSPWVKMDPEPLLRDGIAQMFYLDGFNIDAPEQPAANLKRVVLSNAEPYSPGVAAMANTFIDLVPDTPVAFIMHSVSGSSPMTMADDGNGNRLWENDRKLHDFAVRDGNRPGLHASYFSSSYKGVAHNFGEALAPIFTGRRLDGTRFSTPGTQSYGYSRSLRIDHIYPDLYDLDFTKTMILPIDSIEDSFRKDFLGNPNFEGLFTEGKFDLYNSSVNGRYNSVRNRLDDGNHANAHKEWGAPRRMRMWALSMIEALGEQELEQPLLDVVEAAPNGDSGLVRIGSTSGPISTLRKQLDLPELDASKCPAYGDVFGIHVNGSYVDAYIGDDAGRPAKSGWIYVPKPGGSFRGSDVIGTRSTGFARKQTGTPSSGGPSKLDYYLDDALLSEPAVPSDIHRVWGLHAIMPKESGGVFLHSDITSGRWAGVVPTGEETDPKDRIDAEDEGDTQVDSGSSTSGNADYAADFATDLTGSPLVAAEPDAILRHRPDLAKEFPQNGRLAGALEVTGTGYRPLTFEFSPDVVLDKDQRFDVDLAAYASSLPEQNSHIAVNLYCEHDGGVQFLAETYADYAPPGQIIADLKGREFVCGGANGRVRIEFVLKNPRNDQRHIALMKVAVRTH